MCLDDWKMTVRGTLAEEVPDSAAAMNTHGVVAVAVEQAGKRNVCEGRCSVVSLLLDSRTSHDVGDAHARSCQNWSWKVIEACHQR